ncbi:MAG: hypothetical protein Q9208_001901 [Pyrenodesmia sp. 3 TL-2023]
MGQFWCLINEPQGQPLRRWINEIPHSGLIRYLDFFNRERIAVVGPKALAEVLVHKAYDFTKPPQFVRALGNILGIGLFLAEGKVHKRQRKNLLPAFSYRNIKDLYPSFWSKSQELVHCLGDHVVATGDGHIDIDDWHTSEIARASNTIKYICRQIIYRQKSRLEALEVPGAPAHRDILSVAIASGAFSDEGLVNQLMTFLAAGHESTTAAMEWCIYELCRDPLVQRRIREEVEAQVPAQHLRKQTHRFHKDHATFQAAYIDRCTYLQAFCSEILRLYPPVALTMRVAARNTSIAGTFIPKGTMIVLSPWAVNTSKETWGEDAHLFRPERWLSSPTLPSIPSSKSDTDSPPNRTPALDRHKSKGPETPYALLTFLHGPRSCIGQSFARAELACLVAAWVCAFETEFAGSGGYPVDKEGYVAGVTVVTGVSAKPGNLKVKIRRTGSSA